MNEADRAIVFIDKKTFEQKKLPPYPAEVVKAAFAKDDLLFFDEPASLLAFLEGVKIIDCNLLMMSSGNFGGLDLVNISNKLLH
jgi:UDP-N-acetylmuramate: L-alanyl-gamma-D-glutamyl-meso-diaminopimelate ligase